MVNPVDKHVGLRVRLRRIELGMTQETLAGELGLTSQQVQKYEKGRNRMAASRLHDVSKVLRIPVGFFFEDLPGTRPVADPVATPRRARVATETEQAMKCRGCSCTSQHPCPGGCSLISIEPPVCSACVERASPGSPFAHLETRWFATELMGSTPGRRLVEALSRITDSELRSNLVRLMVNIAEHRRPQRKRKRTASEPK